MYKCHLSSMEEELPHVSNPVLHHHPRQQNRNCAKKPPTLAIALSQNCFDAKAVYILEFLSGKCVLNYSFNNGE